MGPGAPSWTGVDVGSPFDYPKQGILYVARHLPKPGRGASPGGPGRARELIRASGGGALCLFSSRRAAEEAADGHAAPAGLSILCQGDRP